MEAVRLSLTEAYERKIQLDLRVIIRAAQQWYLLTGEMPETVEQLTKGDDKLGVEAILDDVPEDPWGKPYTFELRNARPVASCLGKDGEVGGEGPDADLVHPTPR